MSSALRLRWLKTRCVQPSVTYTSESWVTLLLALVQLGYRSTDSVVKILVPRLVEPVTLMRYSEIDGVLAACAALNLTDAVLAKTIGRSVANRSSSMSISEIAKALRNLHKIGHTVSDVHALLLHRVEKVIDKESSENGADYVSFLQAAYRHRVQLSEHTIEQCLRRMVEKAPFDAVLWLKGLSLATRLYMKPHSVVETMLREVLKRRILNELYPPQLLQVLQVLDSYPLKDDKQLMDKCLIFVIQKLHDTQVSLRAADIALVLRAVNFLDVREPMDVISTMILDALRRSNEWNVFVATHILAAAPMFFPKQSANAAAADGIKSLLSWCDEHSKDLTPRCRKAALGASRHFFDLGESKLSQGIPDVALINRRRNDASSESWD